MAGTVLIDVEDQIATITLNRPEQLNALTPEMAVLLNEHLSAADADPAVRAIVLTGAGRAFCSGVDMKRFGQGPAMMARFLTDPATFPNAMANLSKPVIAAVHGPVVGSGVCYVAYSDVRFASSDASFAMSFARLGLVAEYGLSWLLPRLIGYPAATDLLLSGRSIHAFEAQRLGLINAVLPPDQLLDHVKNYARELAENCSPRALAAIKSQLRSDPHGDLQAAFDRSLSLMLEAFGSPDFSEAMAARQDKRSPTFLPLPGQ